MCWDLASDGNYRDYYQARKTEMYSIIISYGLSFTTSLTHRSRLYLIYRDEELRQIQDYRACVEILSVKTLTVK